MIQSKRCTRKCEVCGKIITPYIYEVRRYRGIFCSRKCTKQYNYQQKDLKICPTCNQPFGTYIGNYYCCEECTPKH